jgi:hypothetical protein
LKTQYLQKGALVHPNLHTDSLSNNQYSSLDSNAETVVSGWSQLQQALTTEPEQAVPVFGMLGCFVSLLSGASPAPGDDSEMLLTDCAGMLSKYSQMRILVLIKSDSFSHPSHQPPQHNTHNSPDASKAVQAVIALNLHHLSLFRVRSLFLYRRAKGCYPSGGYPNFAHFVILP